MTEAEWLKCDDPELLVNSAPSGTNGRQLRLLAVAFCRCCSQIFLDQQHRLALEVSEHFADGLASEKELDAVYQTLNTRARELYQQSSSEQENRRWAEVTAVACATRTDTVYPSDVLWHIRRAVGESLDSRLAALARDVFGNPFRRPLPSSVWRPIAFLPEWRTDTAVALALQMYESRDFSAMPILTDALQDAGCANDDVLNHCREPDATHVRGCWVVDLVLGKV